MNEQALESFIGLCDEMMVPVQESLTYNANKLYQKMVTKWKAYRDKKNNKGDANINTISEDKLKIRQDFFNLCISSIITYNSNLTGDSKLFADDIESDLDKDTKHGYIVFAISPDRIEDDKIQNDKKYYDLYSRVLNGAEAECKKLAKSFASETGEPMPHISANKKGTMYIDF